ncbi:MAG: FKBP-type peptidyl-prolyl cis-trans isomerase [Bacteroidota bacterium]|jgi:FKBP-type peptidyl-prolyl cis-trans isomerase FklB
MKYIACVVFALALLGCQGTKEDKVKLESHKDSLSYAVGLDIGTWLKGQSLDVNSEIVTRALRDKYSGSQTAITDSASRLLTDALRSERRAKHDVELKAQAEKNKKEADVFLAENKKKPGVVTLPSGLQYKVLTMGTGRKPKAFEKVEVNYRGTFIDGSEFENSSKLAPATFSLSGVIRGWKDALQLMPVGSKWVLYVPPDLAYGEIGSGNVIPPNALLIFELELLEVK